MSTRSATRTTTTAGAKRRSRAAAAALSSARFGNGYGTAAGLVPDDLHKPASVALAVELDEQHALPGSELELPVAHRDRLAGGPEQHRHAVRVAVAEVHVLRADVLGALVPVVVRVVGLARHEAAEQLGEVFDEPGLELVDSHAARGVRGIDARDAFRDAA